MGNDASAYVFYGYCWNEEQDFSTYMETWAENKLKASGRTDPWESHPGGRRPDWVAENREAIDAWSAAKKTLIDELPVEWDRHASGDSPMPMLVVKGTKTSADWGEPKPLFPYQMAEPGIGWKAQLDAFLASECVDPPEGENQPGWWMVAYWG